jgi:YegS/Rv2252/BmrU family lipid kinase
MKNKESKKLFIVNPISGGKNKEYLPELIEKYFDKKSYKIVFTERPEHATELALNGIKEGFTDFIAAGGDGTVNEVAKALINTNFNLGILPFGSGNGLARHNGIPMNIEKAISLIKKNKATRIDTCELNNQPFINMSGVGFDAHIGKLFAKSKTRGFKTYFSTTINEFKNYKSQKYSITADGQKINEKAFLISFANSSQYGNNAYIAPNAKMDDGLLDVCIMKPFPPLSVIDLGFRLFTKNIDKSQYVQTIKAKEIIVERENEGEIHLDGEPFESGKTLKIRVVPKSLNLLIHNN